MKLIENPLGEAIPEFMVANRNHTAKGAWRHVRLPARLGTGTVNTTAIGRATDVDVRTGWVGHLTVREMKDRWCRFSGIPIGNDLDNHAKRLLNLRWGRCWQLRGLVGWTPLAELYFPDHPTYDLPEPHDNDVHNFGAPRWWTLSQLG